MGPMPQSSRACGPCGLAGARSANLLRASHIIQVPGGGHRGFPGACRSASALSELSEQGQASPEASVSTFSTVRPACSSSELRQAACLRAEAYFEDNRTRFVESFKRQFARQELESLQQRTAQRGPTPPLCDCLVAVEEDGRVAGCIDIRLPANTTGQHPVGVPLGEADSSYILNVVVAEDVRGQGVGKALMRAAMLRAVDIWEAKLLYTHVHASNKAAYHLYTRCGFEEDSTSAPTVNGAANLGRLVLLRAAADCLQRM